MNPESKADLLFKIGTGAFAVLTISNLIVIDLWIYNSLSQNKNTPSVSQNVLNTASSEPSFCPNACVAQIMQATSSSQTSKTTEKKTGVEEKTTTTQTLTNGSSVKEFYVPFGSGSSFAGDWEDVPGVEAYVDSTQYKSIKEVVFEAALHIPNGNQTAYARLFNATDKHPVWFSEVSLEGGTIKLVNSQPITLDSGSKQYKVQMKTSLRDKANLVQARLRITLR